MKSGRKFRTMAFFAEHSRRILLTQTLISVRWEDWGSLVLTSSWHLVKINILRSCSGGDKKSKKHVFGRCNENARAAGLSPDTMINAVRLGPVVVAWVQLLVADHQLALKQMQLFNSGMAVGRIIGSRREPYQHADAVFFRICCELFAGDSRRHFFPFRSSR